MNKFELESWKQNKTKQKTKKKTATQVWIRKIASDVSIQQFQRCKKFASLNNLYVSLMDSYSTCNFWYLVQSYFVSRMMTKVIIEQEQF